MNKNLILVIGIIPILTNCFFDKKIDLSPTESLPLITASLTSTEAIFPLHHAAAAGNLEGIMDYINRNYDPNTPNIGGQTPLHLAAQCGKR